MSLVNKQYFIDESEDDFITFVIGFEEMPDGVMGEMPVVDNPIKMRFDNPFDAYFYLIENYKEEEIV